MSAVEQLQQSLAPKWRLFAVTVPLSLLFGELFYGTLGSMDAFEWSTLAAPMMLTVVVLIFIMRLLQSFWLVPRRLNAPLDEAAVARRLRNAGRFLLFAWAFSALTALFGMVMFLSQAPRFYGYSLLAIAIVYLMIYYPRPSLLQALGSDE